MTITAGLWRQIVDSAVDTAIISTDRDGRVTSWNSGATRILGYEESEMVGKRLDVLFTPDDQQKGVFNREIKDASTTGRGAVKRAGASARTVTSSGRWEN
jgi:PAS domain S-box-containing protein